jgi:hypothetical protein
MAGAPPPVLSHRPRMLVHVSSFVELPVDLDAMAPGPELGTILACLDLSRYNGFQLVQILSAQQRQVSFDNARLLAVTRELTYTSWGGEHAEPTRRVEPDRFTATEISFALAATEYSAGALIVTALTAVDELPALHQALSEGRIDLTKTRMIVNELADATREHARLVLDKVLTHAHRATTTQLKTILRRALLKLDPDTVRKRHRASVESRRFDHDTDPCGTASLTASYLPPDKAAAAYDYVDAIARASKAAGDPRRLHQLRADISADLLAGVDPTHAGAATPAPRKGAITVQLGLATLAMLDDNPGELPGYGPVIADIARQTATQLATTATWHFQILDHHASTIAEGILGPTARKTIIGLVDRTGYRPTAAQQNFINARDKTCRAPGCNRPAHRCDIDHTCDWICCQDATIWNMCALCRRHHMAKHLAGFTLRRGPHGMDWTTPRGHRYTVIHPNTNPPTILEQQFAAAVTGHTTPGKLRY